MANENLQATIEKLRKKLELIVIGVLAFLLAGIGKLYLDDQNQTRPEVPAPQPAHLDKVLPNANAEETEAKFSIKSSLDENKQFIGLIRFNVFQVLTAEDRKALEQKAMSNYEAAFIAFKQNKLAEAQDMCQRILSELPSHQKTKDLLDAIDKKLKAADAAKKAEATPGPGSPPQPRPAAAGQPGQPRPPGQ